MSDQSDSSRFEPPTEGVAPQPEAPQPGASSFDQPFEPAGPTQEIPTGGSTQEIPAAAPTGWTAGTASNPYDETAATAVGAAPGGDAPTDGGRGGKRLAMMGLGATAIAAVVLGGGYLGYQQVLGGGGAQPESAIPANAIAFAKVDLDPSGGQKIDALRFFRKFPKAPADVKKDDADLRKVLFEQLQEDGKFKGVDYAKDVEPWLGSRFGFAVVPGASASSPVPVVALAVTDAGKAKAGLAKLESAEGDTKCSVGEEFALCGEDASAVAAALKSGEANSLADAKAFGDDFDALGEDGVVSFWADLAKFKDFAANSPLSGNDAAAAADQLKGRVFGALRFDGATLELVGKGTGLADSGVSGDTNGVEALPADTLAAFGLSGGKAYAQKLWDSAEKSGLTGDLESMADESGLTLPADLQTLLGNSFTVAFGGMGEDEQPRLALVTDSAEADVKSLAGKLETLTETPLTVKSGGAGRTVIALEQGYADAVASGKGLGDDAAFKDAVPDADSASVVLYANIQRLVDAVGSDMGADERKVADVFRSVGMSAGAKGSEADFRLRLTTN